MRSLRLAIALAVALPAVARADVLDQIGASAGKIEQEALDLEGTIRPPSELAKGDEVARRRLIDAQVAYGVGNYADASILLYDIVEHRQSSSAYREAVFYLADSLYMKGDNLTSRKYFRVIVNDFGENDPNYGKALERLLELSVRLKDDEGVPDLLARLDRIPASRQLASAPYVRGKFAYFTGDVDGAIRNFTSIDQGNEYYFQAQYFLGASYITKDELAQAVKVYYDLLKVPVKNKKQARVVELAHMALGRLHYHRDQPSEAIEQYLQVSRKSDLFDDALYEVAFVYVKSRQFDKALRALELLEMATGGSCARPNARVNTTVDMPEVCILKGNLGIRKAQNFAEDGKGNPVEEYSTALAIFENTRNAYQGPRGDIEKLIASNEDPHKYFNQVTSDKAFETDIVISPVARKWIRQEEDVARVVGVTTDLAQIRKDLDDADETIQRLERIVNTPRRVHVFPSLAAKQTKLKDLGERLFGLRMQVSAAERQLIEKYSSGSERAEFDALANRRQSLQQELANLTGQGSYEERLARARSQYDRLDGEAKETEVIIRGLEAELVAIERFYADQEPGAKKMDKAQFDATVDEIKRLIAMLRADLDETRKLLVLAKDEAGIGDDLAAEEDRLRAELREVAAKEHAAFQNLKGRMSGGDLSRASQLEGLVAKIDSVQGVLDRIDGKIEAILDTELAEIRVMLEQEKQDLNTARGLLAQYEAENNVLGAEVVAGSLGTVSKKFYEIVVRAEVGIIDVGWAQREDAEVNFNAIELDSAREKRVLETEFSEVSGEPELTQPKPAAPTPTPTPEGGNVPPQ